MGLILRDEVPILSDMDRLLKSRRVLIVSEDPIHKTQEELEKQGANVMSVSSKSQAILSIRQFHPEIVLLEQMSVNDLESLMAIKIEDIDIIFISKNTNPKFISQILERGAVDYICKPYSLVELISRVRIRFRTKAFIEDLKKENHKLYKLSQTDDLTGLFNMRSMFERIDRELRRSATIGCQVACFMMDMDFFKNINDGNDHLFGSFVLKEVGRLLKENLRSSDFAARYGGDEFLVVLSGTNAEGVKSFTERFCDIVRSHIFQNELEAKHVSTSIGYAITCPGDVSMTSKSLVKLADDALYKAKRMGRDCVFGYSALECAERLKDLSNLLKSA